MAFRSVSIPFIAGQWSLQNQLEALARNRARFQSPSLRGSGRFARGVAYAAYLDEFQSPSLRGSGRFQARRRYDPQKDIKFQSPSLRGSGRFARGVAYAAYLDEFQSPSLRGSGRFARAPTTVGARNRLFQSPSLRGSGRFDMDDEVEIFVIGGFNPLHCGAVVASPGAR